MSDNNFCSRVKNVFRTCFKNLTKKADCYYYDQGKMYHCLCNRCAQVYCEGCKTTHLTFESSKVQVCDVHRPMLEFRSDE